MPSIEWSKANWTANLEAFQSGKIPGAHYGDQWGDPERQPQLSVVLQRHVTPAVDPTQNALEIGCGGGRWTQYLLPFKKIWCVDLNPTMLDALKARFPQARHLHVSQSHGFDLPGIPFESIDFAFSFGTLVHCDEPIVAGYLASLRAALKPSGRAHLQFSNKTKPRAAHDRTFADMDPERFSTLAKGAGLNVAAIDDETMPHSTIAHLTNQ